LGSLKDDRDRLKTFESFRRNLHQPEILTFDELLFRSEHIVQLAEADQASHAKDQRAEPNTRET
jgi:hypothetical protein